MQQSDKPEFLATIATIGAMLQVEVSKETAIAYWSLLQDLELGAFKRAATKLMNTSRFFPKPVDFRELIEDDVASQAEQAWAVVTRLVKNSAAAEHPDPRAEKAIASIGGWAVLGGMADREFHAFARRDFIDAYRGASKADERQQISDGDSRHLTPDAKKLVAGLVEKKGL